MADDKKNRRQRSRSIFQDDPDVRTFFGEPDPLTDFDEMFSPEADDQTEANTDLLFGDTEKILADAEAFSERITRRKSRSATSKGSRRRRRPPSSKKGDSGKKDKKSTKDTPSFETNTDRSMISEKTPKNEQRQEASTTEDSTAGEPGPKARADDSAKPPEPTKAAAPETTGERQSAPDQKEPEGTAAPASAAASTSRKGSKERSSKRKSRTRGSDGGVQGLNINDLAKVLLDVLTAEQQQQVRADSQPPCEACIAAQESSRHCAACEDSRARHDADTGRKNLPYDSTLENDDRQETAAKRGGRRPPRGRRRNRGVYYDDELDEEDDGYDEEDRLIRRKPRKVFSQSKRGRRGKRRHGSQRPLAIEETTSTKVVETKDQRRSPYGPWENRFGYPPPEDGDQYYDAGYGPFDTYGPGYYPPPDDAFLDYYGEPMDPWSWQGYPYWCGPCGAGVPAEWPGPYAEQCPCISAAAGEASPGQGTILRREEVWTEGGRHRHRVQEILEGAEPSPGSTGAGAERFQEAPSGFLRDGLAPSAAGSQASTRTGADRPPATRGGGRIVLDAYEEIRPPGCPPSQPLFPPPTRRQSAASVLSQASQQADKNKSESAVPRGRVLYWEEDTHPVRIYAPSEPAVTTEHKMRFKKNIVEGTTTARRASTVELGNLLRGRREAPMSRELKWQSTDGQPKVLPWTQSTFEGPDAAGQWHRTYDDREGGSGTYYLDMTWSTNQVNARYETNFSWSTKKAADKRLHRASISASERKRHRSKLSALEKMSASRTSLYYKTQKGILPKVSTTASRKDSSAARPGGSSDTKTTVALEPPSDLTSPLGTQALGISKVSIATGRRLPGKSKATSLLSQAKASTAKASRDSAAVTKQKQASEVLSPLSDSGISSPHSDLLQKVVSRRNSKAVAKVEVKSPESGPTSVEAECPLSPIEGETVTSAKGEGTAQGILKAGSKSSEKVGTPEERAEPSQEGVDSKSTGKQTKSRAGSIAAPKKTESGQSSRRPSALQRFLPGVFRLMKPQDRKASTAGSRRPSAVTEKQLDKENAERETAAEAEATRTEKPKTGAETHTSQFGESKKAVGTTDEECFASAPGSPYAMRSPSAGSIVAADRHSKEKSKSSATSKTSITSKVSKGGTSEASSVDEGEQVSKPEIEDEPKLQDHPPVAMEIVVAEEPDTESKQDMEEILRELEKQTTVIYPESNLVVVIGVLCILWICLIVFLTNPKYGTKAPSWPSSPFPTWPPFHPGTKQPSVVPRSHVYICSTDFCVKEGEHVAGLISRDVSPCDNFYQYVCRHWERIMRHPAMGIGVATSVDTMLQDSMHTKVLEYILDSSHDDVIEAKRLYEACASSHTGSSTIDLMHIFSMWPPDGRWPVDNKLTISESDVWSVAARLSREFGIAALLGVEAALDKTFGKHVVELQLPQPLFFRGDEQNNAIVSMFRGAITESAQLTQSSGMLYELMSDVMAAFKSIAKRRPILPGTEVTLVTVNNLESGVRTFLTVVFEGTLPGNATVQYRNAVYFEHELTALIREIGPRSVMNYLGFRLLVRLAPLLPKTTNLLRLHSIESVGRVLSPMPKWVLCLRLVASVLPVCVVKAHARHTIASGSDLTSRAWLSQLESLFFRSSRRFAWMDSATHRVARFMLRRLRLARFYPQWSLKRDACAGGALPPSGGAIHMLQEASRIYQSQRLAQFTRGTRPRDVGDAFGTTARFNPGHQAVYVPFGIVNTSVPGNGTVFAFELSRMASRLYAALVPALLEDGAADESALLRFTDAAVRKLDELLDCLARDYHTMPLALREGNDDGFIDSDRARYLLLAQTAAVVLAHAAFKELLHVKRIWKFDFRLGPLPELTSEQLFFAYFARDNCECSDDAYKAHSYVINGRLPPEQRVNFALRHLPAFGEAFHCARDAPMRPLDGSVCRIFQSNQSL